MNPYATESELQYIYRQTTEALESVRYQRKVVQVLLAEARRVQAQDWIAALGPKLPELRKSSNRLSAKKTHLRRKLQSTIATNAVIAGP
jgi:hypothetical protein